MCTSELEFVDLDTEAFILLFGDMEWSNTTDANLTIEWSKITFTTEHLSANHLYNVTITATNVAGSATSYITISEFTNSFYNLRFHIRSQG